MRPSNLKKLAVLIDIISADGDQSTVYKLIREFIDGYKALAADPIKNLYAIVDVNTSVTTWNMCKHAGDLRVELLSSLIFDKTMVASLTTDKTNYAEVVGVIEQFFTNPANIDDICMNAQPSYLNSCLDYLSDCPEIRSRILDVLIEYIDEVLEKGTNSEIEKVTSAFNKVVNHALLNRTPTAETISKKQDAIIESRLAISFGRDLDFGFVADLEQLNAPELARLLAQESLVGRTDGLLLEKERKYGVEVHPVMIARVAKKNMPAVIRYLLESDRPTYPDNLEGLFYDEEFELLEKYGKHVDVTRMTEVVNYLLSQYQISQISAAQNTFSFCKSLCQLDPGVLGRVFERSLQQTQDANRLKELFEFMLKCGADVALNQKIEPKSFTHKQLYNLLKVATSSTHSFKTFCGVFNEIEFKRVALDYFIKNKGHTYIAEVAPIEWIANDPKLKKIKLNTQLQLN